MSVSGGVKEADFEDCRALWGYTAHKFVKRAALTFKRLEWLRRSEPLWARGSPRPHARVSREALPPWTHPPPRLPQPAETSRRPVAHRRSSSPSVPPSHVTSAGRAVPARLGGAEPRQRRQRRGRPRQRPLWRRRVAQAGGRREHARRRGGAGAPPGGFPRAADAVGAAVGPGRRARAHSGLWALCDGRRPASPPCLLPLQTPPPLPPPLPFHRCGAMSPVPRRARRGRPPACQSVPSCLRCSRARRTVGYACPLDHRLWIVTPCCPPLVMVCGTSRLLTVRHGRAHDNPPAVWVRASRLTTPRAGVRSCRR